MSEPVRLGKYDVIAFVNIVDVEKAKAFYGDTLGLHLVSQDGFALVFDANGVMLRLAIARERPAGHSTVLGWEVPDVRAAVEELGDAGVQFERFGHVKQDELGIWTTPSGAKVAWFRDPDGNILSVSEHPE